ncbi:SGNH/GDSL hydrolase family protein [Streptomyces sp. NPDC005423]|uniref:SGNH/GDSL hydrolase family protein n=1 Tax=Streptomyces sp. NPDC005423 TaxID=3155343 RepID=UPI0033AB0A8E
MKTSVRAGLAGALACGTLVTTLVVNHHGEAPRTGIAYVAPPKGPYVALGDSYTAAPGLPGSTGRPPGCDRSDRNYPSLVAAELGVKATDFRDMSCSGATTTDLAAPQNTDDGINPAQLSAVHDTTRLVTLGIGGNDIGFSSMIKRCVAMGMLYKMTGSGKYLHEDAPCARVYVSAGADAVAERIEDAGRQLTAVLTQVRRRAPEARVYVVAYPAILPADNTACARAMNLAPGDVAYLRAKEQQLNTMLRERAERAGVGYVDTYTPSENLGACSPEATRWIEPLSPRSPAAPVHPNERGEQGMADAVLHTIKSAL